MSDYLWKIHDYVHMNIVFADSKAGVVIVYSTGLISGLVAAGVHDSLLEQSVSAWTAKAFVGFFAFLSLAAAALCAGTAIVPRLWSKPGKGFIFWDAVKAHGSEEDYWRRLTSATDRELDRHLADHVYTLSAICSAKYWWTRLGVWGAVAGGTLGILAMLMRS